MRKYLLPLILLFLLSGCGYKFVKMEHLEQSDRIRLIDANTTLFEITKSETDPNIIVVKGTRSSKIILEQPCRVKYRRFELGFIRDVVVTGRLPNGKKCSVWIDTGNWFTEVIVNDIIVKENKFAIFPVGGTPRIGMCDLSSLEIGELTIQNPSCAYFPQHWEFQVLGFPILQDRSVVLGILTMAQFRYVLFDNIDRELEFSLKQSFNPARFQRWSRYPLALDPNSKRLFVDIPIAGQTFHIEFDTGCHDMVVKPAMWEKLLKRVNATKPTQSKFMSYNDGFLPCRKVVVDKIVVGNITVKNAEVRILPENSPYLPKNQYGQIGMWHFRDTVVVLDFERSLMWVKNDGQ